MRIIIESIPHSSQRYETVGDWLFDSDGNLQVYVSETGNDDYTLMCGLHEVIEAWLCRKRGISEEAITAFDIEFENNRAEGNEDEPGDSPFAIYKTEHFFATSIERLLCAELKCDWFEYDKTIYSL